MCTCVHGFAYECVFKRVSFVLYGRACMCVCVYVHVWICVCIGVYTYLLMGPKSKIVFGVANNPPPLFSVLNLFLVCSKCSYILPSDRSFGLPEGHLLWGLPSKNLFLLYFYYPFSILLRLFPFFWLLIIYSLLDVQCLPCFLLWVYSTFV